MPFRRADSRCAYTCLSPRYLRKRLTTTSNLQVDHAGVSNNQLCKENDKLALQYGNKSVLEQHSVDLAWGILMYPDFSQLRSALCANASEMKRFRQLVVNSVMATDIVDKDLKELRNARWSKAFVPHNEPYQLKRDRKATIVIEHLIQASDVAHTVRCRLCALMADPQLTLLADSVYP